MPKDIVLLATPEGWRHSIGYEKGSMICGGLAEIPVDAAPLEAKGAATTMVVRLAREFHGTDVEVTWNDPVEEARSWTGLITPIETDGSAPPHLSVE
ncbi:MULTISPECIES: hypothetical protein [Streptomyces]|uniref:hypothetical protein n=1 Tax=Streptomyces TaxID=1883 RepID=UPI00131C3B7C|nr:MULTISPECIES: hypothetical protein [Streptomyces]